MSARNRSTPFALRSGAAALVLVAGLATQSAAAAPQASGNAYDLSINVSVLSAIPALVVGSQAQVSAPAQPTGFNQTQTVAGVHLGNTPVAPLITLDTGTLSATTEWVPPASASGFMVVGSEAIATNVDLGAVNAIGGSLLSLQAPIVRSTVMLSGWCPPPAVARAQQMRSNDLVGGIAADVVYGNGFDAGNLSDQIRNGGDGGGGSGGGGSDNTGLNVSVTGTPFLNLPDQPDANSQTCILGNTACLTLNERSSGGDGVTTLSSSANGLHLTANVLGFVTADVIIAHAEASLSCD